MPEVEKNLEAMCSDGFVQRKDGYYSSSPQNLARLAVKLVSRGLMVEQVSRVLDWRAFEDLAGMLLEESGFECRRNITLTRPRRQIDLLASKESVALSVDCKHLTVGFGSSRLVSAAAQQTERTIQLSKSGLVPKGCRLIPCMITLYAGDFLLIDAVPCVPIEKLSAFALEFEGFLDQLRVIGVVGIGLDGF
jgi:hypothetical protein